MRICKHIKSDDVLSSHSHAVTIGNFDGLHLGHQALLRRLRQVASFCTVITFSNHPDEILRKMPVLLLTTLEHRLTLLEQMGVDETILISFTEEFSQQTARVFLKMLKQSIAFSHLILGHDAVLGHDRNSDLSDLADELNFHLEYLEPVRIHGEIVSSSEIRRCIQNGYLANASNLLGRPYSIFATVEKGSGIGGPMGFYTANLSVTELVLPPIGVWAVEVKLHHERLLAVANLGHAPTLHRNRSICLEVHLIDAYRDLYGKELEVIFLHYLRPEQHFACLSDLKSQIQRDILATKNLILSQSSG